ncbi:RDD family protein [Microbulbifer sp. ALW1]|uniref:RDD family protein n=1 Tax=Microbulbifer sp. (strain ALW1) TaxID=1516059 RepID=UPI00135B0E1E|nr:RDD family protein [Microbulbifer sp. ALW1]
MTSTGQPHSENTLNYAGFWPRVGASIIDTLILMVITLPPLILIYGWTYLESEQLFLGTADVVINWIFPFIAIVAFWAYKQATPGKMAIAARIVDAKTGGKPSLQQYVVRYIGYFISTIPLGLGLLWVAWDEKKQGWHDKLANTVVEVVKPTATSETN